jgi:hypothetical protein
MEESKKIAAATAAVLNYITTEEEAICIQSMAAPGVKPAPVPSDAASAPVRLWGASGRQAQMQMRNLMQMRTFK